MAQLELCGVLDGHDALRLRDEFRERVEERCLSTAGAAADDDVGARRHGRREEARGLWADRVERDEILKAEQLWELADRDRRSLQGERRDDDVHAEPRFRYACVDRGARLVDAPPEPPQDPLDDRHDVRLVVERDVGALDDPVALDEHLARCVDHDLLDLGVVKQRLDRAVAEHVVDDVLLELGQLLRWQDRAALPSHPLRQRGELRADGGLVRRAAGKDRFGVDEALHAAPYLAPQRRVQSAEAADVLHYAPRAVAVTTRSARRPNERVTPRPRCCDAASPSTTSRRANVRSSLMLTVRSPAPSASRTSFADRPLFARLTTTTRGVGA